MINYLIIAIGGALCSLALAPAVRALAFRIGAVDRPGLRRIHSVPTARLGGVAVYVAMIAALALGWTIDPVIRHALAGHAMRLAALVIGSACLLVAGAIDDRRSLGAGTKFAIEIACAALVIAAGSRIRTIFGIEIGWVNILASVLWIVAVTNAINMVDGLDGLATGLSMIISASLFSIAMLLGSAGNAAILAALCGALAGFLFHNFHPARIFLGDSGSLFIGFVLAVTAIDGSNKAAATAAIMFPLLSLGLPLAEVGLTTIRRALGWINVVRLDARSARYEFSFFGPPALFTADREHIHHRMLAMGLTHRNAVIVLYGVCAALGGASFVVVAWRVSNLGLLLAALALGTIAARKLGYRELRPLANGLLLPLFYLPLMNRRSLYLLCDLAFIAASYIGAWLIWHERMLSGGDLMPLVNLLPLWAAAQSAGLVVAGFYRRSYRYAGVADLIAIGKALMFASLGGCFALLVGSLWHRMPLGFLVIDTYLLASFVVASRLSFRCLEHLFHASRAATGRALIYGAGNGGVAALHEIRFNPSLGFQAVGFLDDDPRKFGRILHGIPIFGWAQMESLIFSRRIDTVVIASIKIPEARLEQLSRRCAAAGIALRNFHIGLDDVGTVAAAPILTSRA